MPSVRKSKTNFPNPCGIPGLLSPGLTPAKSKYLHCNENPIHVFLLLGLSPNFHIHMSVSDLYIPRISTHILLQENRQTDPGNIKSLTDIYECRNWETEHNNSVLEIIF